jgi:DNA-binding transcriptional MerR regulator
MSVKIENRKYYRTAEVCRTVGISKATLFRWLKEGTCGNFDRRDIRGWRLFTREEIETLKNQVCQIDEKGDFNFKKVNKKIINGKNSK